MKIITKVPNNPGRHRPHLGSGPKNLRIYRSTPGSSHQSQTPGADPRVAALTPEAHGTPQNSTPFALGRKRMLGAMLASTFHEVGVSLILTTNLRDFTVLGDFVCVAP